MDFDTVHFVNGSHSSMRDKPFRGHTINRLINQLLSWMILQVANQNGGWLGGVIWIFHGDMSWGYCQQDGNIIGICRVCRF